MRQVRKTRTLNAGGKKPRPEPSAGKKPIRRQARENKKPEPSAGKQRNRSQARENQDDVAKCGKTRQPKPSEGKGRQPKPSAENKTTAQSASKKTKYRNKTRENRKFVQIVGKKVVIKIRNYNFITENINNKRRVHTWCTCDH